MYPQSGGGYLTFGKDPSQSTKVTGDLLSIYVFFTGCLSGRKIYLKIADRGMSHLTLYILYFLARKTKKQKNNSMRKL